MDISLNVDHLRSWIGREESQNDTITIELVCRFNASLDLTADLPAQGDTAPPLIQYCLAQPAALSSQLGEDGHPPKGGFLPPVPLPRRMWAGSSLTSHGQLKVGDMVTRISRVADVSVKEGRSGILCFVTIVHKCLVDGILKIEEIQNIVYRDAAASRAERPQGEPAPTGEYTQSLPVSAPLLFRYSALTFNGHRIHYDRPYATTVEYYPGLVVHGPLQATFLLNYATQLRGSAPSKFSFRGQTPLFDDDKISLHATEKSGKLALWTCREGGPIGMSAEAEWA